MRLEILKSFNDFFTPVNSPFVEERQGSNFSLVCHLMFSINYTSSVDDNLAWVKTDNSTLTK